MKKILALALVFTMLFTLSACGDLENANLTGSALGKNEIAKALDEGYEIVMSSCYPNDKIWKGIFQKDGSYEDMMILTADITMEQYEKLESIEWNDEKADEKRATVYGLLSNVQKIDISGFVPSEEELNSYIGMTLKEFEESGFENSGYTGDNFLFYDGTIYSVIVEMDRHGVKKAFEKFNSKDYKKVKVKSVEFTGFAPDFLDQYEKYI